MYVVVISRGAQGEGDPVAKSLITLQERCSLKVVYSPCFLMCIGIPFNVLYCLASY